ncbi:hypothetical protein FHU33_3962 [Blastococcus colisei]|uniref:Uncharacterized protein n=1 Tax=Blastococcus colisei TaxID=1564162 RepID=A0A543NZP9_9ACTN|nr:hypothetical protein [Blastococcus colisei]TQN37316.1 hypothetical protein FHU33_3962 [Blastococcus colisei]
MADGIAPAYGQLLQEARELGRADGMFAAAFETPGISPGRSERCIGRTPAEFARLLWEGRPGTPPIGLEVNAPLWYSTGFHEGLEAGAPHRRGTTAALQFRRVFG